MATYYTGDAGHADHASRPFCNDKCSARLMYMIVDRDSPSADSLVEMECYHSNTNTNPKHKHFD